MPHANRRSACVRSVLGCVAVAGLLAACATDAQNPERRAHERPMADGEGLRHEGHRGGPGGFASLFISPAGQPFRAHRGEPYPVAAWFAAANTAQDGRLTRAEVLADAAVFFRVLDADHDGIVDGFEVSLYEHQIAPEIIQGFQPSAGDDGKRPAGKSAEGGGRGGRGGGRGGGHGGGGGEHGGGGSRGEGDSSASRPASAASDRPQGAAWFNLTGEAEPVASADTEFNGRITLAEFLAAVGRRFDALDAAGRGYLVLAELPHTPLQDRLGAAEAGAAPQGPARPPS